MANVSLEHHLAQMLEGIAPLEPLDITLAEARGCQLADDVLAPRPIPHFASCALAGYAVRSAEVRGPTELTVVDRVSAGFAASQPVYSGVTVEVGVGAPLPHGADAVAPGDPVSSEVVRVAGPVVPGQGVIDVGATAAEGAVLLTAGSMIDSRGIGLLASLGRSRASVRPRPRVVIVSVGNALLSATDPATEGLEFDSAGPMLAAAAGEAGAISYRVGPIDDESRLVRDTLEDQLIRADLLIVMGGIDSSSHQVRTFLESLGSVSFDDGSTGLGPFGHGTIGEDRIPVLSLPGDPARAAMLFTVLAVPMITAMRGVAPPAPVSVRLATPIRRLPGVTQVLLARTSDDGTATALVDRAPTLVDLVSADVIVRILPGDEVQAPGTRCLALDLRHGSGSPAVVG